MTLKKLDTHSKNQGLSYVVERVKMDKVGETKT